MGTMYAWATKEYLLWNMTIGQIVLYHNKAIEIKNGTTEKAPGLLNKTASELKKIRDETLKAEKERLENEKNEAAKQSLRQKYGDI